MLPKKSGVYKIQSISHPEREYIGSAVDIRQRWNLHKCDFNKKEHSSVQFQRHYNKYGLDDFIISVIALCSKEELIPQTITIDHFIFKDIIWIEQCFIWAYQYRKTGKPYFNASYWAGNSMGVKWSQEAKDKMSKERKGKKKPPQHGINVSKALKGKPKNVSRELIDANIARLAEINRGSKRTPEQLQRQSESLKKHWAEHPRKPIPLEERAKHGRPCSDERKLRTKEWWRKRKELGWVANKESQHRNRDSKGHFIKTPK